MKGKINIDKIMEILGKEVKNYKVPIVDLIQVQTNDPFKVLVATILSARTKDEVTTVASKKLFNLVKEPKDLTKLTVKQIEKLIFPVGFYQNKARFLKKLPLALEKFGGVPDEIDNLVTLPGVGRKTANLVRAVAFNKSAICVDTHVHRITNRWGYIKTKNPLETEFALRKKLPKKHWIPINSILVAFGQHLCRPVGPQCYRCPISHLCNYKPKTLL